MVSQNEKLLGQTIEALYLAVSDEAQWPLALEGLSRAFDSPRVAILRAAPRLDRIFEMRAINHDPEAQRQYQQYYWSLDPSHRVTREAPVGQWLDSPHLFDPATTPEREYMDFAIRHGIRWVCGGKVHADDSSVTILGLQRPADHGPFDSAAAQAFGGLARHIGRASSLAHDLRRAELAKGLSLAALDGLGWPVYAVDLRGKLLLANRQGESQLMSDVPFRLHAGCLGSPDAETARCLRQSLQLAGQFRASAFRISIQGHNWTARTLPITAHASAALVYVTSQQSAPASAQVLQQLLGFSPAEAEISGLIADGWTAKEIAHARSVSINTVRGQVRDIFRKAGVRRQTDLAKILWSVPSLHAGGKGEP